MTTLVYFVKNGENEALRYSLRSLVNMPHDRVVVVGGRPSWLVGVDFVDGNPSPHKWENVWANLVLAADHVTGRAVVMNDDFFAVRPIESIPSLHRSTLAAHVSSLKARRSAWCRSLSATLAHLQGLGHPDPLSYELHLPVEMDMAGLAKVLAEASLVRPHPQWRTLYGVRHCVESTQVPDVKMYRATDPIPDDASFVSTTNGTWSKGLIGQQIRSMFTDPSPYEEVTTA